MAMRFSRRSGKAFLGTIVHSRLSRFGNSTGKRTKYLRIRPSAARIFILSQCAPLKSEHP